MIKRFYILPFQLIAIIFLVLLFGSFFADQLINYFYTFSYLFDKALSLILPLVIFTFIVTGILSYKKRSPVALLVLIFFIVVLNFFISMISFGIGNLFLGFITKGISFSTFKCMIPLFKVSFPKLIGFDKVILSSIGLGIFFSLYHVPSFGKTMFKLKELIEKFLKRFFVPLLPLYIFGFMLKFYYEGRFFCLFKSYGKTFFIVLLVQACYLFLLYFIASGLNVKKTIKAIKNAIPSYINAFYSMSSRKTIPVTTDCAEKNKADEKLVDMAVPIAASVHLAGSSITLPLLVLVTAFLFTGIVPDFYTFFTFVFYFCLTMFADSKVKGSGIIVMIPILKAVLNFTPEMTSIIIAVYLLQDSFISASNVMGDGALTIIVNKVLKKFRIVY